MKNTANLKVTVDKKVRQALKVKTAKNGTTIQAVLETAIIDYLQGKNATAGQI